MYLFEDRAEVGGATHWRRAFSWPGEEQNKEALQDVEDEAQWDDATSDFRPSLTSSHSSLPPYLTLPSQPHPILPPPPLQDTHILLFLFPFLLLTSTSGSSVAKQVHRVHNSLFFLFSVLFFILVLTSLK